MKKGSKLRRELGEQLRALNDNGVQRFLICEAMSIFTDCLLSADYKFFEEGGRLRLIAPDSILREQSSHPLRQLLVEKHGMERYMGC